MAVMLREVPGRVPWAFWGHFLAVPFLVTAAGRRRIGTARSQPRSGTNRDCDGFEQRPRASFPSTLSGGVSVFAG